MRVPRKDIAPPFGPEALKGKLRSFASLKDDKKRRIKEKKAG
jgi:hypothetical protein